jgi:50S ribosomal subunit-associated GTPase HflX
VVSKTLAEIGAGNIPVILVLNKIDLLEKNDEQHLEELRRYYNTHGFSRVVFISASNKQNISELRQILYEEVMTKRRVYSE